MGDPAQLTPTRDLALYHNGSLPDELKPKQKKKEEKEYMNARKVKQQETYLKFNDKTYFEAVLIYNENMRIKKSNDDKQKEYAEILKRMHDGVSDEKDYYWLRENCHLIRENVIDFAIKNAHDDYTQLFYTNKQVDQLNNAMMTHQPYYFQTIPAVHAKPEHARLDDDLFGSRNLLKLKINSKVRVTTNVNTSVGLTNGAEGRIVNFIYENE